MNGRKTKELLIRPLLKDLPPSVSLSGMPAERITAFKLLGVHVASNLKWLQHVDAITSKAAKRHFLKQLKRSGATRGNLLCFYGTVIRPVLEYACPVWHSSLTVAQTKALESLQLRIIYEHCDYTMSLIRAGLDTLESRREELTKHIFKRSVLPEADCAMQEHSNL